LIIEGKGKSGAFLIYRRETEKGIQMEEMPEGEETESSRAAASEARKKRKAYNPAVEKVIASPWGENTQIR